CAASRDGRTPPWRRSRWRRRRMARSDGRLGRGGRARQIEAGEEERDLGACGLGRVGSVGRVLLDVGPEFAPDGAPWRLLRVGGAHQVAPALDGVLALEHAHEHGTRGHELHEVPEERTLAMHGVKALRLVGRQVADPTRHHGEAAGLDHREYLAESARANRVGLDDEEGRFGHESFPAFRSTSCIVAPSRAGLADSVTPAASSAAIFSAAVPLPPAMIAPACPIRLPLGAVCPAMKLTTGFVTCWV